MVRLVALSLSHEHHASYGRVVNSNWKYSMPDETNNVLLWRSVWIGAIGVCFVVPLSYVVRYRRSIRKRLDQIEDDLSRGLMVRSHTNSYLDPETRKFRRSSLQMSLPVTEQSRKEIFCLELNPDFVERHKRDGWNLISLGE